VRDRFRTAGIETPERDARLLAERAFGLSWLALTGRERDEAPAEALTTLDSWAARRLAGEPVARLLGEKGFWGLDFLLGPETLVPRPETELLVEKALAGLGEGPGTMLDLGTGTGCIPIALLTERPALKAVAVDLADGALEIARQNAERHSVSARLDLRQGSWFGPVAGERFSLITSNPPYIESGAMASLMPEVRFHDPALALDGGPDGLGPYRIIVPEAPRHLLPGGRLLVETGTGQGDAVAGLFRAAGFLDVAVDHDLAGHERVVSGRMPG